MKFRHAIVCTVLCIMFASVGHVEAKTQYPAVHGGCAIMYAKFAKAKMVHSVFVTSDGLAPSASHQGTWTCTSSARASVTEAAAAALQNCQKAVSHFAAQGYKYVGQCTVIQKF